MNFLKHSFSLIVIGLLVFACSSPSDKDHYDLAISSIKKGTLELEKENSPESSKHYLDAVNEFEIILKNFPNSEFTDETVYELGKLYHGQVIKSISKKESFQKAVDLYMRLFEEYPNKKETPNSLFMAGFIQANKLKNLEAAKNIYSIYLENYPEGEMAPSTKIELANLGKSPEEILKVNKVNKVTETK